MGKKKGGKKEQAPIFSAAEEGNVREFVDLLKEDSSLRDSKNEDGWTPLHMAAFNNQVEIVNTLIKSGAKVNAKCKDGDTPLHYASAQGSSDCLAPLVKAGADTEARDNDGESPLDVAPSARVKMLIRKLAEEKDNQEEDGEDWEELSGDEAEEAMAELELNNESKSKSKSKSRKQ
mmetsp:Transcript_1531/g.2188  ORF Transcript_1531/g.2188 Transcript_1531/m.2188 type:complete len:176 (+) Transcript_1531:47-574(+)|eukprot:CAMPEP_0196591520 /NCGR_PEP_ID=MMETSP1081-20130531/69917_1 /TAXON_ID=36882 /ORGANISM="Pyramimonas amylifera, Strain CCMP720" /LENGTH=175 /DNA_ID=CAMNT_0041914905 /DNA_START=35 /DNA_END=562 /DNA_ORIENTATION=-